MKDLVQHYSSCLLDSCQKCEQVQPLVSCHAGTCQARECSVPGCNPMFRICNRARAANAGLTDNEDSGSKVSWTTLVTRQFVFVLTGGGVLRVLARLRKHSRPTTRVSLQDILKRSADSPLNSGAVRCGQERVNPKR